MNIIIAQNRKDFFVRYLLLAVLYLLFSVPAGAQQGVDLFLANLQTNAKLHAPDDILADFVNGEPETAVIVLLQPTAAAEALSVRSRLLAHVPSEFTRPGAPAYYNLHDESIRTQLKATVTETHGRVIDQLGATGMMVTRRFSYQFGFAARVTPAALEQILNSPDVVTVEKDHILQAHLAQGIPLMNAGAVRSSYTGAGVSIAICDTGIDTSHPRLGGGGFPNSKVIGGYDTGDNDADPRPNSVSGQAHGTACAGIAAGNLGTVGDYIGGVAPDAKLYAIKISTGNTGSAQESAMIAGWEWAITHKNDDPGNPIMIISTSFGGGRYTSTCDSASSGMTTAAANAVAAGITIFASSGNDGYCDSIAWPACISYVNSVGAVFDGSLGTYGFCVDPSVSCAMATAYPGCSTGYIAWNTTAADKVTSYSNSASFLTIFAPSHDAYTTDIVGAGGYSTGDYTTDFGGTSAASPYAAGSAAVLQQAAKAKSGSYLTPAQVKTYLVNNGDNVTDGKVAITKPRINLGRAVAAIPNIWTVTATASGNGSGTIASSTGGISYSYPANNTGTTTGIVNGTAVTLTATANTGSTVSWTNCAAQGGTAGGTTTAATCAFLSLTGTKTVAATFTLNQYTVTATASGNGNGTIISSTGGISYSYPANNTGTTTGIVNGTAVTLTATANTGSTVSWTNCAAQGGTAGGTTTAATCAFLSLTGTKTVAATFTLNQYTVTATASSNGNGTIASSTGGISYSYPANNTGTTTGIVNGTAVTLTATANTGSTVSWTNCAAQGGTAGGTTTAATCAFSSLTGTKTVAATFTLNQYTVTATANGNGNGTMASSTGGISYAYPASNTGMTTGINHGTAVTLTATANTGSTVSWTNCAAQGGTAGGTTTAATCAFSSLTGTKTVAATFTLNQYTLTTTANGTGSGTITSNPLGIDCGGTCSFSFDQGALVTLTPAPDVTSIFTGWSGACSGAGACQVTMNTAKSVTANFTGKTTITWNVVNGVRETCVNSASALATALYEAGADGYPNTIKVVQGTYTGLFAYSGNENYDLGLFGGYVAGCASFSDNPELTILNGDINADNIGDGVVLDLITTNPGGTGNITVEGFHVKNGLNGVDDGGCIRVFTAIGSTTVTGNIVSNCAAVDSGGIDVETFGGNILLANNIVYGNTATTSGGGIGAVSASGTITVLNNTITGNTGNGGGGMAVGLGATAHTDIQNNIIWGNIGTIPDVSIDTLYYQAPPVNQTVPGTFLFDYNDAMVANIVTNPSSVVPVGHNINGTDPLFANAATGDYHLMTTSPVIDMGNSAHPLLPVVDIDGQPRIIGPAVDIGADELPICKNCTSVQSVNLTATPGSPQLASTQVTFKATASGGSGTPQYQFWVRDPQGNWTVKQSYGSPDTYGWTTPSAAGAYQIAVWAKNYGSGAVSYEVQQMMDYTVTVANSLSLGSDKVSPQAAGVAVRFTATSGGFTNPRYQFWVRDPLGAWTAPQSYGSLNTYDWTTPSVAGAYQIAVWVKSQGSGATYDIQQVMDYTVTVSKSLSLGSDKASPQAAGVAVRFTAASGGFTNPQYQFWVRDPQGAWTVAQSYGSLNTYDWTTPSVAGAYQIAVWVKSQGSGATYDIQQVMDYTVTVSKSLSLGSDKASPQAAGVAVRFTATSGGFTNPQYQFWVRDPQGAWTVAQSYGSLNTYDWTTPSVAGAYQIAVWVKSQGSGATYDIQQVMDYTVTVSKSLSLGSDKTSPQAAGVAVRFTATSGGFTNPQYQFWVRDPQGAWTVAQSYGSLNTYDWTTPSVAGAYQIAVWVKSQGSGETYEIQQLMDFNAQ